MPSAHAPHIAPSQSILIQEVAVATGISTRKINRLIDDAVLPQSLCVKIGNRRALHAFAVPMVGFGAADGAKLSKDIRLKAMRLIGTFAKKHWRHLCQEPEYAKRLQLQNGCIVIALGKPVSETMAGLNKWVEAQLRIVKDPEIRGGIPVVRGTRVGVYEVASAFAIDGVDIVLEGFPALSREDVEAAVLYAKVYPITRRPRANVGSRRLVSKDVMNLAVVA